MYIVQLYSVNICIGNKKIFRDLIYVTIIIRNGNNKQKIYE